MYYSDVFFKKSVYELTEQDIIDFFANSQEESSILEFKSGDVELEKVYNEVAALHNSQGGLLIIGSPKPIKIKGRETFEGSLTHSKHINKDRLYQKINSNVSPPPIDLRIHDIQTSNGELVQVLDIPKSLNPPHQSLTDGKYYIRYETSSKFAPHGLVEAMFNRRNEPSIDCDITKYKRVENEGVIIFKIINTSDVPLIGINYIIKFYNVESCWSFDHNTSAFVKINKRTKDHPDQVSACLDTYENSNRVIVNGIFSGYPYKFTYDSDPFVVELLIWSTNMGLKKFYFIINTKHQRSHKIPVVGNTQPRIKKKLNEIINECKQNELLEQVDSYTRLAEQLTMNKTED
jgi:hypothetical protein